MYVEELKYSLRWKPVAKFFPNKNLKLTCKLTNNKHKECIESSGLFFVFFLYIQMHFFLNVDFDRLVQLL